MLIAERKVRRSLLSACAVGALACAVWLSPASAHAAYSSSSEHEQIAWVRSAASDFVSAELAGNGAGACAKLTARERASSHGRTCEQRWDARLAHMLHEHGERARLRTQLHQIAKAAVDVHGDVATLALSSPLLGNTDRLRWTENCWMIVR